MNKINIDLLVPDYSIDKDNLLDVESMAEVDYQGKPSVNKIIQSREIDKKKLKNCYKNILKSCFKEINEANSLKRTDIIYKIPHISLNNINYRTEECLTYIEKKLRSLNFDTLRIKNNSLFITWFDIEKLKNKGN